MEQFIKTEEPNFMPNKEDKYETETLKEQKKPEHTIIYIFYSKDSQGLALTDPEEVQPGVFIVDKDLIQLVDWQDVINAPTAQKRYEFLTEIVNLKTLMVSKKQFLSIMHEYYEQLKSKDMITINTKEIEKDIDLDNTVKSNEPTNLVNEEKPNKYTISDILKQYEGLYNNLDPMDKNKQYNK